MRLPGFPQVAIHGPYNGPVEKGPHTTAAVHRAQGGVQVVLRPAALSEIFPLRWAELRPGLPPEAARFPGDEDARACHFGAFDLSTGRAVCCASFIPSSWEGRAAWQLRGMATAPPLRGRGVGAALLRRAEEELRNSPPALAAISWLWCNARLAAVGFYQKQGWTVASEVFDIPTVGPHHRMFKRLEEP